VAETWDFGNARFAAADPWLGSVAGGSVWLATDSQGLQAGRCLKVVRQAEEVFLKVPQCQSSNLHFEEYKVALEKFFEHINEFIALTGTSSLLELVPEPTTKVVGVLCLTAEGAHVWQEAQDSFTGDFASLRKLGSK
jgi:hypothetical protein